MFHVWFRNPYLLQKENRIRKEQIRKESRKNNTIRYKTKYLKTLVLNSYEISFKSF